MTRRICARFALLSTALLAAGPTWAQGPTPSGNPFVGHAPGAYPATVTAANINASLQAGTEVNTGASDSLLLTFPSAGPIAWTNVRQNEGDLSPSIGPRLPADPTFYPPATFNNFVAGDNDGASQAWRVSSQRGALLASVRTNGQDDGLLLGASNVGTIQGIAYFNQAGSGRGYHLTDGVYADGGASAADLQIGYAGYDNGLGEAVVDVAAAYFPYEEGWLAGWVTAAQDGPGAFDAAGAAATPGLEPSAVSWAGGIAQVALPGVNSATDGMLFVAPTNDVNTTNIAAAFPKDGGWSVAVREDENAVADGTALVAAGQNGFQFLYVPYSASNLIGGQIGGNGASIHEEGGSMFNITRTLAGTYELTVLESDLSTKRTEDDGMLVLSVAGTISGNPNLADRTYLSYEYDSANQKFIIESRATMGAGPSENIFGDELRLTDTDFYFAWVDFEASKTLALPSIPGDFDGNQMVNGDDLNNVWKDSFAVDGDGDADGDGDTDGNDFLVWQQNVGTGVPATPAAGAVPEPGAALLMIFGVAALAAARKRIG